MKGLTASMLVLTLMISMISSVGCRHNVNTNPQVVFAQTLLSGADAVDTVSIGLAAGNDALETLQAQGTIEPEYYASAHQWLVNIAKANDKAIAAIRLARAALQCQQGADPQNCPVAPDWKSAVLAVAVEGAKADPATFGIKNPDSKNALKLGLATLQGALISIPASFGK
jgi:hypothetical protein